VLEPGEAPGSPRAVAAAGHAVSVMFHYLYEHRLLDRLPGGEAWGRAYDAVDPSERHLAMHDRHLVAVNERDRPFITGEVVAASGRTFTPGALRDELRRLARAGVTELVYQPAGPDIPRELGAFARAAEGAAGA
jgi:5,10-methylenetetrahydromethanopterin reductase